MNSWIRYLPQLKFRDADDGEARTPPSSQKFASNLSPKLVGKHLSLIPYDILVILFIGQSMLPAWAALILAAVNFGTWWCYYRIPQFLRTVSGSDGQSILIPGPIVEYFARFINSCGVHHRAHYGLMLAMMAGFHAAMTGVLWDRGFSSDWASLIGWTCYIALLVVDCIMYLVSLRTLQELRRDKLQEANRYTDELKRSNEDLEQFAYIASHDLRAPLRGILNLTGWIKKDVDPICSKDTKHHLALLEKRILRMDQLLNDLLQYSRVGRDETETEEIDLCVLAQDIFDALNPAGTHIMHLNEASFSVSDYRVTYDLLLDNLLANAIKHHDRAQASIWVSFSRSADTITLCVEDDGPGIPPEYRERIFDVFSTLTPRDKKEASGMGLAIIKKIVTHKKGTILVNESQHGGVSFTLTLPLNR